jgi:hypothetical protein
MTPVGGRETLPERLETSLEGVARVLPSRN